MKRAIAIAILIIVSAMISGCAVEKIFCPSERAYFLGPDGRILVMEKDFFNEAKKQGRWLTQEKFNLWLEKYKRKGGM